MQAPWLPFLLLVLGLAALVPASRWLGTRIQGLVFLLTGNAIVALYVYFVLLLPGTLLHELSHWVMAGLLGVRVSGLSIRPQMGRQGMAQFGSVTIDRVDPARESLIGVAPLLVGSVAVALIATWRFGSLVGVLSQPAYRSILWRALVRAPDAWLWLYVMLSVSNAMLPSASDRQSWLPAAWIALLLVGLTYALGLLQPLPTLWFALVQRWAQALAAVFGGTALLDLLLGGILRLLEEIVGLALGRKLVARR